MATQSSTLAWKIPWMEEPGGLQSMGSQRVGHDLATEQEQTDLSSKRIKRKVGFSGGSESKAAASNEGDPVSIPGWGRSPGERNGNPLQYFCLENPMDRGAWQATVHGVAKSRT